MLVRVLRPFVLIRFARHSSTRFGQFATEAEAYLCRRDAGLASRKTIDLFYHAPRVCNDQLKKMWDRTLRVSLFGPYLPSLNLWMPGSAQHVLNIGLPKSEVVRDLFAQAPPHLSFTPAEERLGLDSLGELGIPDDTQFICFNSRDSAFLDAIMPQIDWRVSDYRDSTIHNYILAAEELVHRGYFALRMGAIVKEPLNTTDPMIIDYATRARTDFMDIYLGAKCRFLVCGANGLSGVSSIFRRPIAYVNCIPMDSLTPWGPDDLHIFKKLWLSREHRFMRICESLESGAWIISRTHLFEEAGIEVVENTPEEIAALAVEMEERLQGIWQAAPEDEELQEQFWALFEGINPYGATPPRIGAEFLRQNRDLIV